MRRGWLVAALLLSTLLLAGHMLALEHYLYWRYWWFDVVMHVLGGLVFGAIGVALRLRAALFSLCIVLVIFGWEVFEYINNISTNQPHFYLDTLIDLVLGALGAAVIYVFARK
jgi:hypothetical protein